VIFEVFEAVRMMMMYFRAEDGDSMCLRNVGIYRRVYTAPRPRSTSLARKPVTAKHGKGELV
jgi:hypothetical protein